MQTNLRQLFLEHVGQTSDNPMLFEIERAEGVWFYGPNGQRWMDLISGVSVSGVGHGNQRVVDAICRQAQRHLHLMVYGEVVQSPQVCYAQRIASLLPDPLDTVYFVNSGSEAVEGALKLAKRYTGRTELVGFRNAYHGSTHGALSVMGGEEYRGAYRPLLPDTRCLPFSDTASLTQITSRTAAVIIEPVQGEGGIQLPAPGFLPALRARCTEVGALLIFDEMQTGMGRSGALFEFMKHAVVPDILCVGKAFGGGMPLGGFIAPNAIMSCLKTNPALGHITTFGGHPVCCAAGLAALEYLLEENLMPQAETKGALYETLLRDLPGLQAIRRTGLLLALEFGDAARTQEIVFGLLEKGLLTEWFLFHDTALRIAPPLTITEEEIRWSCDRVREVVCGR